MIFGKGATLSCRIFFNKDIIKKYNLLHMKYLVKYGIFLNKVTAQKFLTREGVNELQNIQY